MTRTGIDELQLATDNEREDYPDMTTSTSTRYMSNLKKY